MSRQNFHVRINQSGTRIGIESVENLTTDQICGSRGNSQPIPDPKVPNPKSDQPSNPHSPRRSIAIGVNLSKRHSNNPQYNPLENPKTATQTQSLRLLAILLKRWSQLFSVLNLSGASQFNK